MRGLPATLRWGAYFTIALGLHAAGAAALITRWNDSTDAMANAPVIMIDLAPVAVAPKTTPVDTPPNTIESKQQIEPEPTPEKPPEVSEIEPEPEPEKPVEKADIKPEPVAEPDLALLPPPKPPIEKPVEKPVEKKHVKKKRQPVATFAHSPSAADRKANHAAAPMPGAAARNSDALPDWKSRLIAQIIRHKRYPPEAMSHGDQGSVRVSFRVDRHGGLHHARIVRSSGSRHLDRDALAWLQRSQPLPPPPASVPGTSFAFEVPLRYTLR
jgi:protein TonB